MKIRVSFFLFTRHWLFLFQLINAIKQFLRITSTISPIMKCSTETETKISKFFLPLITGSVINWFYVFNNARFLFRPVMAIFSIITRCMLIWAVSIIWKICKLSHSGNHHDSMNEIQIFSWERVFVSTIMFAQNKITSWSKNTSQLLKCSRKLRYVMESDEGSDKINTICG